MMRLSEDHHFPLKLEVPNPHTLFYIKRKTRTMKALCRLFRFLSEDMRLRA